MQKMMRIYLLVSALLFMSAVCVEASDHLLKLKSKFPLGLLGDDYGVLTSEDLAVNACRFKPEQYPPKPFISPYEYWKCFDTKNISMKCESSGIRDDNEGLMGLVVVRAATRKDKYEYIERRPWKIRECRSFVKDLTLLLKNASHGCISGSYIEDKVDKDGGKTISWLFERLKTNKGCEGRNCDLTEAIKQNGCPHLEL